MMSTAVSSRKELWILRWCSCIVVGEQDSDYTSQSGSKKGSSVVFRGFSILLSYFCDELIENDKVYFAATCLRENQELLSEENGSYMVASLYEAKEDLDVSQAMGKEDDLKSFSAQ